jgi:hypothetical protein
LRDIARSIVAASTRGDEDRRAVHETFMLAATVSNP